MLILDASTFETVSWEEKFPFGRRWRTADNLIVSFLSELSRCILSNKDAKQYPDLITFGFFCRKSNIKAEIQKVSDRQTSVGWGTLLHITPSNIPINFAYSFVMGLLAGNSNIVRLPSKSYPQNDLLLKLLTDIFSAKIFLDLSNATKFVQTHRESKKLDGLLLRCDGLNVWGSDETVTNFRKRPKKARCVEVYFPNRASSTVLSAQHYLDMNIEQKNKVAHSFFNDTYLVDQNACSSPTNIFWLGSYQAIEKAKRIFWERLASELGDSYSLDPVARIDKILDVMDICKAEDKAISVSEWHPDLLIIEERCGSKYPLRFGTFAEVYVESLDEISQFLRPNEQTITTLGVDPIDVYRTLVENNFLIADRIVPIGRALDIGLQWDGKKMMEVLSRKVEVR
ncbi:acyl-CoA reductase [Pseudopelagicola sp. nBUS_20]|uniref:acyl-CoA reductase n=1 Tax=Pseudopelagicola sp. nBUS_20 TaxID=3395317 RepID=UPI003EB6B4EE